MPKVSVILITYNEAANIRRCLTSVKWADEVIIVDSQSTDDTIRLAEVFSNVKIIERKWEGFVKSKQIAVENTTNDWVLWLDADEEVTTDLEQEIKITLESNNRNIAFDMPRKTFFLGEWIKHCGWYPGRIVRLFNKKNCGFSDNLLHEKVNIDLGSGEVGHLKSDLLHYSYTSLYQYFDKMNKYGQYGAEELQRRGKKFQLWQLILNPISTFIKFYFFNKGFLEGKRGFIIGVGSSFSNFIKYVNFYYLEKEKKSKQESKLKNASYTPDVV